MKISLLGGWGYANLGDEAILAGYVEFLQQQHEVTVLSRDHRRTQGAQRPDSSVEFLSEYHRLSRRRSDDVSLICGGGYLNGHWKEEVRGKLRRLQARSSHSRVRVVHAVEVRNMSAEPAVHDLAVRLFEGTHASVRDNASRDEVARLGTEAAIVPDAISLLYPHLSRFIKPIPELEGKVVLNLQPITNRHDAEDAYLADAYWDSFSSRLVEALGSRAVGLVGGDRDLRYMARFPDLPLIEPRTVSQLLSCLAAPDAVFSVRMHPALLASMLGRSVCSVPYNGKIRPTLAELGLSSVIDPCIEVEQTLARLADSPPSADWESNYTRTADWLTSALTQ